MIWLLLLLVVVIVAVLLVMRPKGSPRGLAEYELDDALAEARRENERLGGQVYNLVPSNEAAGQALADAAERHNAAGAQLDQARTPVQARLAKQTAFEGLYYIRAARTAMGMDPGPAIPQLAYQNRAGRVTEDRIAVYDDGRHITASPTPSSATPHYFPGGLVAGRPVPGGWYSEPWWRPALLTGAWTLGATALFTALFADMPGITYDATTFEQGFDEGNDPALGEYGNPPSATYDDASGYDSGGYNQSGYDSGGYDQGNFGSGGYNQGSYDSRDYNQGGGHNQRGYDSSGYGQGD
ncbi:DUF1542 domain-containing protein [Nocardia sp. NPDC050712]|uniref:DUF1542 domain-containing protein n=1 Tax=Nocardia sp. NPDC050712 TaxID=3155518 RepID=UPI0033DF63F2